MLGVGLHGPTGPAATSRRPRIAEGEARYGAAEDVAGAAVSASGEPASPATREAMAVIAGVEGIGPITLERLLAVFGDPVAVLEVAARPGGVSALRAATRESDDRLPTIRESTAKALAEAARRPGEMAARLEGSGVHVVLLDDAAYPDRLRAIELPPRLLFVRGADAALDGRHSVAVVGTRRPTDEGRRTANRIGAALARAGTVVVSGLALGIDGAAHAAVLGEAGQTVAVIGGGHDRLFPRAHDRLADAIVDGGGAVISEHAPGTEPTKGTFPRRNRVISGLADAVVVVEAGARSGALVTAAWALEQGRECFLVPGSIEAPLAAGCLAWLRDYAGLTRIVAGVP
ncbi:MAG: DNA-protecting protein DprA, partial [Chloroflexi bacterium]|nr:DNA-protecting protein DprA [Chloroflexota bacterium]